jgi:hypothetical protein
MVLLYLGGSPLFFIHGRIIHPRAMNKGIYYSRKERVDTPQPDGSVVKHECIQTLGLYIIISSGIRFSKRQLLPVFIMSLYFAPIRYQHNDGQDILLQ